MARLKQFLLLLWKNFKLQFRHPWVTLLELGVPTIFMSVLLVVRMTVASEFVLEPTIYQPFNISYIPNIHNSSIHALNLLSRMKSFTVLYAPGDTPFLNIMEKTTKLLPKLTIKGFENEDSAIQYYLKQSRITDDIIAAVIFKNGINKSFNEPSNIKFKIRPKAVETAFESFTTGGGDWKTKFSFPFIQKFGPRSKNKIWGGDPGYMYRGFLPLQHAVSMSIIDTISPNFSHRERINLQLERYPYPPYDDDAFLYFLQFYLPIILLLGFAYPVLNIVRNVVIEKERKMKESMKMMGLSTWLNYAAWFLKYFVFLCITLFIITFMLTVRPRNGIAILNQSDPSVIFLFLLVYMVNVICFAFFMSSLFNKAPAAATGTVIIFSISYIPFMFIFPRYAFLSFGSKLSSCLLLNVALPMGTILISTWESTGYGLHWDKLGQSPIPGETLTMNLIFLMMFIDGFVYLLLMWYIESVFPGDFGIPEVWYFPFTRSYWCGSKQDFQNPSILHNTDETNWEFFETEPSNLTPGIQINGITKVYSVKHKPAVNNLCLNMYRGQITVLLGHNGAGKTTTISMLTGLFPPTSGEASVNGYDVCDDIEGVHSCLGICPQHDVLFDDLTVEEHFYFFAKLKNYIPDLIQAEVNRMVEDVGLKDKRHALAGTLSGGMKRKLSVGIAFVGGSQVVMLDEPTSGLDPSARRTIWDLIQAEKEDRTILLTTHFMEEADILGDRIAIMAEGEIQCCGSSLFLKKKYGAGYHLVMVKEPNCDVSKITDLITSHIPNAELSRNIGTELTYLLQHESSHLFESLFLEIETSRKQLKISSFGASITTMEEVFIKVGQKALVKDALNVSEENLSNNTTSLCDSGAHDLEDENSYGSDSVPFVPEEGTRKNTGIVLFCQQFQALLLKRILYSARNKMLTLVQLGLPAGFLIITILILKTLPKSEENPPLLFSLNSFDGTQVPYTLNSNHSTAAKMAEVFSLQFNQSKNIVTRVDTMNLTSYLIEQGKADIGYYNTHNMIAASIEYNDTINETLITSWFNNQAFHTPAIALWSIGNMLLKYATNVDHEFSIINHPMPRTAVEKGSELQFNILESYQISQNTMTGMAILISCFIVFLVKERAIESKHLQRVSGVNLFCFWLTNFLWDLICYMVSCLLLLIVFVGFKTTGFYSLIGAGRLILLLVLYGFATLSFTYCVSFMFKGPVVAFAAAIVYHLFTGIATVLIISLMEIPQLGLLKLSKSLDWVFSAFLTDYCLGRGVRNLYQNYEFSGICNVDVVKFICDFDVDLPLKACCPGKCGDMCIPWLENSFAIESPGIGKQLIFLSIQTVLYLLILIALEMNVFRYLKYLLNYYKRRSILDDCCPPSPIEEEDVVAERQKILTTPLPMLQVRNRLILKQLTKRYNTLIAVNKLSLGIKRGECFGLLGLNGAGKTTTFKMITGEVAMTSGDIYVDGLSVRTSLRKVQQRLGYCPQFDALIDDFTGRETLTIYARLRGVKESDISEQITKLTTLLSLEVHIDKLVREYSGGNKRKLSLAIALIGDPPMVFLDEPTTGMDPVSRHSTWNVLLHVLCSGRSIVLTSHSMEECEALCSKLVIMVNGKLCCLGSPQHLKSKFGKGFTLLVKVGRKDLTAHQQMRYFTNNLLSPSDDSHYCPSSYHEQCHEEELQFRSDIDEVNDFIRNTFSSSILKDCHEGFLHYHIPDPKLSWSQIFGAIERAKQSLNIVDYSVGQTTLEQVFLNFAQAQRESY